MYNGDDFFNKLEKAHNVLTQKFTSGNSVPVERNTITAEEWEVLKEASHFTLEVIKVHKLAEENNYSITSATIPETSVNKNEHPTLDAE